MTSRTRKLAVLAIVVAVVLVAVVVPQRRNSKPPFTVKLFSYTPGGTNAIIAIINHSRFSWNCWCIGTTNGKMLLGTLPAATIGPQETWHFPTVIAAGASFVRVSFEYDWTQSAYDRLKHRLSDVSDIFLDPIWFATDLPLPQHPPSP
jgi:hypothetical protein